MHLHPKLSGVVGLATSSLGLVHHVELHDPEPWATWRQHSNSTETKYEYRKRRVAEIPSAEEIDDTNVDDTSAITAMSTKKSLKYTMSLGK